jgi:hypothetical protein
MTPPRLNQKDDHFRFDTEFVKLIERQSEQKIMLNNLNEKIENIKDFNSDNFDKISAKLEDLGENIRSIQNNCLSHKILDDNNKKLEKDNKQLKANSSDMVLHINPMLIKAIIIIIGFVIAYLFGIEPKLP